MRIKIGLIVSCLLMISCISSKKSLNLKKVEKGEQLEYAQEISVDQFLKIWMHNRLSMIDINCREIYKDTNYVYFVKNKSKFPSLVPSLYKVNKDSLTFRLGDYNKIDAQRIKNEFWEKVSNKITSDLPEGDYNRTFNKEFDYSLNGKKILITLRLKVESEKGLFYGYKKMLILEKNYKGYYDIIEMKIIIE